MDLEGITLSEMSQILYDLAYVWNLKPLHQTHGKRDQICGYKRLGARG